jgi:transcriptional regulator with XRE-family HTH domain
MKLILKELLKSKEMTTASLADKVGITRPNMSNIVNGKNDPSIPTLDKIAVALGVSVFELFERPQNDIINCPNCGAKLKISKI